jgi:gas vesicle protein
MDRRESGSFPAGFLVGAFAGIFIGFLVAPAAGRETRSLIRDKAGAGLNRAKEAAAAAAGTARKRARRQE